MRVSSCIRSTALLLLYCCFTADCAGSGSLAVVYPLGLRREHGFIAPPALLLLYYCFTTAVLLLYCCFTDEYREHSVQAEQPANAPPRDSSPQQHSSAAPAAAAASADCKQVEGVNADKAGGDARVAGGAGGAGGGEEARCAGQEDGPDAPEEGVGAQEKDAQDARGEVLIARVASIERGERPLTSVCSSKAAVKQQ
jgi:hypothetical protein